ncbi:16S rRNA (adenine1518-N6/adenine1519-N6)-dimethyltransferase [Thermoactinomyces sp. DSM 45891]|uniref:16S rRNA (adenine(1518)-N(6)/adenine(1519)-N(6))- dimethyltransferase RsmA n=1 Tax=Thermoactinomyces sp. DSM 45891 TaxID=1761907 RepID=UPI000914D513|nr:16S rRNA (adenine(1518)-N(6)/adenine(1519)-N(6))-dimethyltransferase RsmA [Thermoactinomyces sp. DSM 45891]SFX40213.1 16S rRNA (adenine1518-N6/adenine1519-N6)-dimethyltransferase [Thermoactinomyces sp. DSM 45891]
MSHRTISQNTKQILAKYKLGLKKSLGQNFLTDDRVLEQIADAADLDERAGVIEIGPGIGALTERLSERAKKVVAVELDQRLIPVLGDVFEKQLNIEVIHGDALKVDFHEIISENFGECNSIHVVANLPYYVTSPILIRLLEEKLPLQNIVIMIQKEVADRLVAKPGTKDYGSLSVLVQYYTETSLVTKVPSHVFVPRPNVDSAVVKLSRREAPAVNVSNESLFFKIVRASFAQRRKTLLNTLHSQLFSHLAKSDVADFLNQAGIDPQRRGETLHLAEFATLTEAWERFSQGR